MGPALSQMFEFTWKRLIVIHHRVLKLIHETRECLMPWMIPFANVGLILDTHIVKDLVHERAKVGLVIDFLRSFISIFIPRGNDDDRPDRECAVERKPRARLRLTNSSRKASASATLVMEIVKPLEKPWASIAKASITESLRILVDSYSRRRCVDLDWTLFQHRQ